MIDTTIYCKHCKQRLANVKFQSYKGGNIVGYDLGKYCPKCRILFIYNHTIKIEIEYSGKPNLVQ
jgi:phage FluMu protein Com